MLIHIVHLSFERGISPENLKNPSSEVIDDKLQPNRLEKSLENSQACTSAQALSIATIQGLLFPTVPALGPVKAQKAEITAHSVPQNENLGANLEKFEFLAHKGYPELKKQLYSSI